MVIIWKSVRLAKRQTRSNKVKDRRNVSFRKLRGIHWLRQVLIEVESYTARKRNYKNISYTARKRMYKIVAYRAQECALLLSLFTTGTKNPAINLPSVQVIILRGLNGNCGELLTNYPKHCRNMKQVCMKRSAFRHWIAHRRSYPPS